MAIEEFLDETEFKLSFNSRQETGRWECVCVCALGFKGLSKELFQIKGKQVGKPSSR